MDTHAQICFASPLASEAESGTSGIKDRVLDEERKGVVYEVPCTDCSAVNIGETLRTVTARVKEHQRDTERGCLERSALAAHSHFCNNRIAWKGAKILCQEQRWDARKTKEALMISNAAGIGQVLNTDSGWKMHPAWQDVVRLAFNSTSI